MAQPGFFEVMSFAPGGWGLPLAHGAAMTVAVALCGFTTGAVIGVFGAWAKIAGSRWARGLADAYTTVLRGIPDLLVIYLFYFGGSSLVSWAGHQFGAQGFIGVPGFLAGVLAVGVTSGAFHTEVLRGAYRAIPTGEIEAAVGFGMPRFLLFRRIIAPLALRHALPGLGNVWQVVLKESALVSVTGTVELLRQSQIGAGSTGLPFYFFAAAAALYLAISSVSGWALQRAEAFFSRGVRRA